jgi:hypothetical protein
MPMTEDLQPYTEQHGPCGQLPQTVFPLPAPHVPSVVSPPPVLVPVAVGLPKTGSWLLVNDATMTVELAAPVQPF